MRGSTNELMNLRASIRVNKKVNGSAALRVLRCLSLSERMLQPLCKISKRKKKTKKIRERKKK